MFYTQAQHHEIPKLVFVSSGEKRVLYFFCITDILHRVHVSTPPLVAPFHRATKRQKGLHVHFLWLRLEMTHVYTFLTTKKNPPRLNARAFRTRSRHTYNIMTSSTFPLKSSYFSYMTILKAYNFVVRPRQAISRTSHN